MATIYLEVVTPYGVILKEDVDSFSVTTTEGEIGVLPHHIPLFTNLAPGVLRYWKGEIPYFMAVMDGFLEVAEGNRAVLLSSAAEQATDIDQLRATEAKKVAQASLSKQTEDIEYSESEAALQRSLIRLKALDMIKEFSRTKKRP